MTRKKAMTPKELLAHIAEQKEQVKALTVLWEELFPEFKEPGTRQFKVWLNTYGFDTVVYGLNAALVLCNKRATKEVEGHAGPATASDVVQYASGSMKKQKADADDQRA